MASKTQMWWIRSTFFLSGGRGASIARFLPLIFVEEGLSDSQIGIVLSSAYFAICFLVPVISAFTDLKNERKSIFLIIALCLTATISLLYLLPYYWFNIKDDDFIFYWSLLIMIFYSIPSEFAVPILDALCLLIISNDKKKYGQIRSYTAMSWGLFHCIIGILLEFKIIKLHFCLYLYSLISIPMIITTYFSFYEIDFEKHQRMYTNSISISTDPDIIETDTNNLRDIKLTETKSVDNNNNNNNKEEGDDANSTISNEDYGSIIMLKKSSAEIGNELGSESKLSQYLSTLKFIFSKSYTIGLFLIGFTFGGGWVTVQSLLFVYITDLANTDDTDDNDAYLLMGLSVGISVIFEIPFMYCSEWFVKRLGYRKMIIVGFSCYVLRLMGYTLLTSDNLWLLLIIETLQGFTMGLVHVAIVTLCAIIFPQHLAVTAQGLMSSIRFGFAPFIFLFVSGYIMQYLGGQWLYRGLAMIVFITLILFYLLSKELNQVIQQNQNIKISNKTKNRALSIASDALAT